MTESPKYVYLVWANMSHLVAVCETSEASEKVFLEMVTSFPEESFYRETRGLVS